MRPIEQILRERFEVALGAAFGPENVTDPLIKTGDPRHADYQSNVAMALAKSLGSKPRDVATRIVQHLKVEDISETPVIAGPGFINIRLKKSFLAGSLTEAFGDAGGGASGGGKDEQAADGGD